jgi:hypothetical protein
MAKLHDKTMPVKHDKAYRLGLIHGEQNFIKDIRKFMDDKLTRYSGGQFMSTVANMIEDWLKTKETK